MIHKILRDTRTPWQYLDDLVRSDRGPEHNEVWMTERLQRRWPGNYQVKYTSMNYTAPYYIAFDSKEDELWFALRYAK